MKRIAFALTILSTSVFGQLGFNYTAYPCNPNNVRNTNLITGNRAYVCLTFNGRSTAVFTPTIDSFSAIQLSSSNIAVPEGAGLIHEKVGWIPSVANLTSNCTDEFRSRRYYVTFDVRSYNVQSNYPKIYKNITFDSCPATEEPEWTGPINVVETLPVYTAIISMTNGVIDYIDWDQGCIFCAPNGPECVADTFDMNVTAPIIDDNFKNCKYSEEQCYPTPTPTPDGAGTDESAAASITPAPNSSATVNATAAICDLKLYIVWSGTDANGRYLTSAGRRFSRFRKYGTSSLYQGAVNIIDDSMNMAQRAINYVQTIPGRLSPDSITDGTEGRRLGLHFDNVASNYDYLNDVSNDNSEQPPDEIYEFDNNGIRQVNLRGGN